MLGVRPVASAGSRIAKLSKGSVLLNAREVGFGLNNLCWVSFLKSCQTVYFLVLLGISIEKLFVDMLLELRDLLDMWVILIVDVVRHEIDALKAPFDLT